jgi:PBP1b-binding outer membrane lipoprotein LpoB
MKKTLIPIVAAMTAMLLLTGCLNLQIGGGDKKAPPKPTVGQQMTDLQKAKDSGAITEPEYQAQKARVMRGN